MNVAEYIGIPYKDRGRDRDGLDCWGLVKLFYSDVMGIDVPGYLEYDSAEDNAAVADVIDRRVSDWKQIEAPEPGCVLLFRVKGLPIHCGIYLGRDDFLHAFKGTQVCIERLNSISWSKRLLGAYTWVRK